MLAAILGAAVANGADDTVLLHAADSIEGAILSWGAQIPGSRVERNVDCRFISEGTGSIHVTSVAPAAATGTSYVGVRLPIEAMPLKQGRALAFEAWSSHRDSTKALYARGLNEAGEIVAGWSSWSHPVSTEERTFVLVPERSGYGMRWEDDRIEAPEDAIVAVEFIAGCVDNGKPFDLYIDHVRALPAPEPKPTNVVKHGLVAPVGMSTWGRSTIATVDADGGRVVFTKLWTGGDASYLFIDAQTGETEQIDPGARGWGAYRVLMTPENVIYDTIGRHLVAIDVPTRQVRRLGEIPSGMALSFVRGSDGTVFAGIYPSATLVSYDPESGRYTNHGALNTESWPQYLRPLVMDEAGWVYGGIGIQEAQVVGINPANGAKRTFIPEADRQRGNPRLFAGTDGKVYANAPGWGWHVLSAGTAIPTEEPTVQPVRTDVSTFPDGSTIADIEIPDRELYILDPDADEPRKVTFDYKSTGVNIYTIVSGPDRRIHGATGIPLRIWEFDPETGEMQNRGLGGYGGHINQFARQGDKLYGAVYSSGALLEYDPSEPYDDAHMSVSDNPKLVHSSDKARNLYGRPHAVLAHPDGRHILVGGNAARVILGSGLLIYDIQTGRGEIVDRADLIPDQGINALLGLPGGDVLVGTNVRAPTGGAAAAAKAAMIYRFDLASRAIEARWILEPATPAVRDMVLGPDGLVYGLAEPSRLFVFDPESERIIHDEPVYGFGNASGYQAPRCMIVGPDEMIYALFRDAVVRIEPGSRKTVDIARPESPITSGIAILDGRLYFGSGPRLLSCAIPPVP